MESEDMASLNFDRAENYNSIQMKCPNAQLK